jgi:uncharacterized protein with HEPN domain
VSRHDDQRLADILAAAAAITDHTRRGDLDDDLVFDAVRVRLIEIGEAVKGIDPALLAREPDIPWVDVAGMRNHLAHRYFDTALNRAGDRYSRLAATRGSHEKTPGPSRRRRLT